jgi:hypothetical protein
MEDNKTIKVFDYCLSKLGQSTPSCAKSVANLISNNKTLVHVDFSGNNFSCSFFTVGVLGPCICSADLLTSKSCSALVTACLP